MEQTNSKIFIGDAIKGGWKGGKHHSFAITDDANVQLHVQDELGKTTLDENLPLSGALLDIFAWQAVGKVRTWEQRCYICKGVKTGTGHQKNCPRMDWDERIDLDTPRGFMHQFIDHLADGRSVNKALQLIHMRVWQ